MKGRKLYVVTETTREDETYPARVETFDKMTESFGID